MSLRVVMVSILFKKEVQALTHMNCLLCEYAQNGIKTLTCEHAFGLPKDHDDCNPLQLYVKYVITTQSLAVLTCLIRTWRTQNPTFADPEWQNPG